MTEGMGAANQEEMVRVVTTFRSIDAGLLSATANINEKIY